MRKPASLRAALVAALDARHRYSERPADLHMVMQNATPIADGRPGMAYMWEYTLAIGFLDFTGAPDEIALPILVWLRRWQGDAFGTPERLKAAFNMDVEFMSDGVVDVLVRLKLTENVNVVPRPGGDGADLVRPEEPVPFALRDAAPLHAAYLDGEQIVHCTAHPDAGNDG
ncbi:MAG: phage tail protein [Brevundimonas sp.]|uniref:phage tail protein n=1 Tax=Brevundimonas sp. TaxID=1871086 RepID=UPI002726D75B|nr:phage tail protein [Brevundimonas sp.]MDO9607221.1 phage tail protein [Brevundimonas sp.]